MATVLTTTQPTPLKRPSTLPRAPRSEGAGVGVLGLIGKTPLLDLSAVLDQATRDAGGRLFGKAEFANPGGSVKDRPAAAMVDRALRDGLLVAGQKISSSSASSVDAAPVRRLLDATSGNTGIAYAMIGASLGLGVTLCVPANASPERMRLLAAYGAEVIATDPLEGSDGAIVEARRMVAEEPDRWAYLDQYSNPENWRAHYRTTGPEIVEQTAGRLTHFVTGLGTSGTFTGVGRYLRDALPSVRLVSVEPDGPFHGLEGMKHMASALVPAIYDRELADEARSVATEAAHAMCRRLGRDLGLLVGISAGANVRAACDLCTEAVVSGMNAPTVVTVLCDGAAKYLSDPFWDE